MPKIRVTCTDPYATDCSSDDDGDESIEENKPKIGGLFVNEISLSLPIIIPTISTFHFDSLAKLKLDSSFAVHESKSSEDRRNCVVLALPARRSEGILRRKSGTFSVQNRVRKLSKVKKYQVYSTRSSSRKGTLAKGATEPTDSPRQKSVDIPVAKKSRSLGAEKNPGLTLTSSGKFGVRIRDPITSSRRWLGSYTTIEEAMRIYNKTKLEYTSLRCESAMEDASIRVDEPKSSVDVSNCVVLALSARGTEDTSRNKSGNGLEKLPMDQRCQLDIPSPISAAKTSRNLGAEKHPGLKLTKSGKYGVQIRDPMTRTRIWLGTYNTIEEAKNIYNKKNLEYTSYLRPTVIKHNKHSNLKAKRKGKGKRKRQKLVIQGISVLETVSGKWGVSVRDPVSKHRVWLGSHVTPEEAVESYHKKMLEFDSTYNHYNVRKAVNRECIPADVAEMCVPACDLSNGCIPAGDVADTCIPFCDTSNECIHAHDVDSSVSVATIITGVRHPEVKLTDAEKWRVAIRHPMLKNSVSLGSYDTAEVAEKVYNRNKLELDAVLHSDEIFGSPTAVGSDEGVDVKKYKGVRPSGNSRWLSQINNPFKKKSKVYLGTFSTAEEAAEAYNRTRREFDAIISLVNKCNGEAESEAHKAGDSKSKKKKKKKKKPTIIHEEAGMLIDDRTRLFEIVVNTHCYVENSANAVVNNQGSNYISKEKHIFDEFGMGIIDSYGQLVGEYSRLDDELWLSRPGEEEDLDVNGAFFNGNGELAWDFDSKPSLSSN